MTAKKTAAKKTAAKKTAAKKATPAKSPEPMDPSVEERAVVSNPDGTADVSAHAPISARLCWALTVLLAEVKALYPEVAFYVSEVTGRKVGVAVTFEGWDVGGDDGHPEPTLPALLTCIEADPRVAEVTVGTADGQEYGWVSVRVKPNPVTMDTRDTFNLDAAYAIQVEA
jgi:hypothetical protein